MALMLGIRLVSWGLAGTVVGITHQYTKDKEEKLYKWIGDKFLRRSPDPAAPSPSPNSGDPDPIPSTADQLQPQVHNVVDGNLTAELFEARSEERDLAHSVNIDEVELTREAPDLVHASPALPAVRGESAVEPPRPEVVNLRREAPDPAAPFPNSGDAGVNKFVNTSPEAPDPDGAAGVPSQPALPAVEGEPAIIYSTKKKKKKRKKKKPEPAAEPPWSEALNLSREAPEPVLVTGPPALPSVQGESTAVPPLTSLSAVQGEPAAEPPGTGSEAVNVNLSRQAPDLVGATGVPSHPVPHPDADPPYKAMLPDPPPATGVGAVVKDRATGLWPWAMKDPDADPPFKGMPPDPPPATGVWAVVKDFWARAMKDPDLRYKFLHIPKAVLLVFVDHQFRRLLKDHKFWLEAYNKIFKFELSKWFTFF